MSLGPYPASTNLRLSAAMRREKKIYLYTKFSSIFTMFLASQMRIILLKNLLYKFVQGQPYFSRIQVSLL